MLFLLDHIEIIRHAGFEGAHRHLQHINCGQ